MKPSEGVAQKWGLHPRERGNVPRNFEVEVFGHTLSDPIGTSAGIDGYAEIPTLFSPSAFL